MPNPLGGINRQKTNPEEAANRADFRAQDIVIDLENPQPGPVEDRTRASKRKTRTNS